MPSSFPSFHCGSTLFPTEKMRAAAIKQKANAESIACHHRGPPGPLAYWPCKWDEKTLVIENDFELMGIEKRRLLRLRPDFVYAEGRKPSSRVEFTAVAA